MAEDAEMPENPIEFSFYFDPEAVQAWLEKEGRMYDQVGKMYEAEWQNYVDAVTPIWEEMNDVNMKF